MSISTHVLDTARGRPAAGITVRAERRDDDGGWTAVGEGTTDADGRIGDLVTARVQAGTHRLCFAVGPWFAEQDLQAFYDDIAIAFVVTEPDQHHHVPLLLSPFGYSTYRGS